MKTASNTKMPMSVMVTVAINGVEYDYFMTNDQNVLVKKLDELGCRAPAALDWQRNPNLAQTVRDKMAELEMRYSLTTSNGIAVLNDCFSGVVPHIVSLSALKRSDEMMVDIDGTAYLITNDWNCVKNKVKSLNCRSIKPQDWRYNPSLPQNIRNAMADHETRYSFTSNGSLFTELNYYAKNGTPYVIYLSDLKNERKKMAKDFSPLMIACANGAVQTVKLLLEQGSDVNFQGSDGLSALMVAAIKNNADIVRLLVRHGAHMDARTKNGTNALILAIIEDASDAVKVLIDAGASIGKIACFSSISPNKMPFLEKLYFYIQNWLYLRKNTALSQIYKRCGMSKQTFSKIISSRDPDFRPKKETVIQLAIGMKLTLAQTEDFLGSAGYYFLPENKFDEIIKTFISQMNYNLSEIETELLKQTGRTLLLYDSEKKS